MILNISERKELCILSLKRVAEVAADIGMMEMTERDRFRQLNDRYNPEGLPELEENLWNEGLTHEGVLKRRDSFKRIIVARSGRPKRLQYDSEKELAALIIARETQGIQWFRPLSRKDEARFRELTGLRREELFSEIEVIDSIGKKHPEIKAIYQELKNLLKQNESDSQPLETAV
jgi:hypothetical protein